jgi:carbonyl reductase 1
MEAAQKRVFVTGGNAGIGMALCKQLASEDGCYVYMGSRSLERGADAIKAIVAQVPSCEGKIEVVQVDVSDP